VPLEPASPSASTGQGLCALEDARAQGTLEADEADRLAAHDGLNEDEALDLATREVHAYRREQREQHP
jgi:hypothetical protein